MQIAQPRTWPYLVLFSLAVICVTVSETARYTAGVENSMLVSVFGRIAIGITIVAWLLTDARRNHKSLCYDFDTMAFYAWPIVVPAYFVYTRGWRFVPVVVAFLALYLGSWAIGYAICGIGLAFGR